MIDHSYYVYTVLARGVSPPPGLTGLGGGALVVVPYRDLAAAASVIDAARPPSTVDEILRHEAIVERLRESGPSLPVRFGTVLTGVEAIQQALAERYEVLLDDLARVGEMVEYGLMVLWPDPPLEGDDPAARGAPVPDLHGRGETRGPGAAYLRVRVDQHRRTSALRERAGALAHTLDGVLRPHVAAARYTIAPTAHLAVRAAYLIHPSGSSRFQEVFEEVRHMRRDLRFLLSGPWPPYSFVTSPAAPDGRLISPGGAGHDISEDGNRVPLNRSQSTCASEYPAAMRPGTS